jgi:hypothetical protein
MRSPAVLASLVLLAGLAAPTCSDDTTSDGGKGADRGGRSEAGVPDTARAVEAGADTAAFESSVSDSKKSGEAGVTSDLLYTEAGNVVCDTSCTDPTQCVKVSGQCKECSSSLHCTSNPFALGPTCDTSVYFCVCSTDSDCTNNPWGAKCDTTDKYPLCYCTADADCSASSLGTKCHTKNYYCSCSSDSDCASSEFGTKCNTTGTYPSCYCTSTSDCPSGKTCTGTFGSVSICS